MGEPQIIGADAFENNNHFGQAVVPPTTDGKDCDMTMDESVTASTEQGPTEQETATSATLA